MRASWKVVTAAGALTTASVAVIAASLAGPARASKGVEDRKEKVSYGMGVAMVRSFQRQGDLPDVDVDAVARGMRDALAGKLAFPEQELRAALAAYQAELKQKQERQTKATLEANQRRGEAYLAENARKEGVKVLPSGLQYRILEPGHGNTPTDADTVQCQYRGVHLDGTEFDSSYRRGKPATFKVASVIPAWREALKLMPVGSKWQLFVPAGLAYGDQGASSKQGTLVAPGESLVFELEFVAIEASRG